MNYFTKKRLTTFAIVLLVIINISSITTILIRRYHPIKHPLPVQMDDKVRATTIFLKTELQFSDEQVKEFIRIQDEFLKESETLRHAIGDLKKDLHRTLIESTDDTLENAARIAEIGNKHSELEKILYQYFINVKNLCTPEQVQKFDVLVRQILFTIDPGHQPPQDKHSPPPHIENGRPPHSDVPPPPPHSNTPPPPDRRPPPN